MDTNPPSIGWEHLRAWTYRYVWSWNHQRSSSTLVKSSGELLRIGQQVHKVYAAESQHVAKNSPKVLAATNHVSDPPLG